MLRSAFGKLILTILLFTISYTAALSQNQALDLSGAGNEVNVTYNPDSSSGFTIEYWVNLPSGLTSTTHLINQTSSNIAAPFDLYVNTNGSVTMWFGNGVASNQATTAPGVLTTSTWHHIALVFDPLAGSSEGQLFIDGNTTATLTLDVTAPMTNVGPIRIGRRADGQEGDDLLIDELRIWSIPRAGTAISTDFDAKLLGNEAGLDLYLQFENDLNDDASGNGVQNGTIAAGSIGYVNGAPLKNNALNFDGTDDHVAVSHDAALNLVTGDFTLEAWVYWSGSGSNTIISKGDGNATPSADVFILGRRNASSKLSLELVDGSSAFEWGDAQSDIPLNTWTHVAVTFEYGTQTATFYQNGQFDGTHTFGFTPVDNGDAQPMYIGRQGTTCNCNYWNGNLDEIRIWNTIRTQQEIVDNAYMSLTSGTGLVASYDFNQGSAGQENGANTTLPDISPNTNDGTLTNFTLNFASSNWVASTAFDADVFPPQFIPGYPLIDNVTTTGFDITVQLNEPGTYFYVVVPDGATAPSVDDVRAGTGFGGTGEVAAGNIVVTTPATDFVLSPTGLTPNTFYDLYIVAQDDEGSPNVQNTNTVFDVTTEAGFVTRWITSDGQITIPTTGGGYNYSVEWNNITNPGTNEGFIDGRTGDYTITGMENGSTYEVIIRGDFPRIYFNNAGDKDKIQSIEQWGNISWTFFQSAFYGCSNLTYNATDAPDLSGVSGLGSMFRNASSFNATDLTGWDVSTITDMGLMFSGATAFNGDVSNWDVSNVVTMTEVFRDLPSFNSDISGWITTSASNMLGMFQGSSSFNRDLSGWDLNGVGNTSFMFFNASSFDQDLGAWDVTTVSNMTNMLSNTAISVANYDAILGGWAAQSASLQVGVTLGATGLGYSSSGEPGRNTLTTAPSSWTISGDLLVPAAPTDLIAYATSPTEITLKWTDNATSETGYLIERADDYAFTANVTTVLASEPADTDSVGFSIGVDQPYYYRVTPTNGIEDATSESSVVFATTSKFSGHAMDFSSSVNDYLRASTALSPTNNYTYEFWFKPAANLNSASPRGDLFDYVSGLGTPTVIFNREGDGTIRLYENGFTTGTASTSTTWQQDRWYHLAATYDGTTYRLYIDGVEEGNQTRSSIVESSSDLIIGNANSLNSAFNGSIDEFRIYDYAKSDFSDRFNYLAGNESGLLNYYSFDENGGTTVVDKSTNTDDATINGTSAFVASTVVQDGVVSNTNDTGPGSLRDAMDFANANPGTTITFDIANSGPWSIDLQSALPSITANNTIIDGVSQSGWTFGDANAMVTLNGSSVPANNHGLDINASGVEVYGLIITGFTGGTTYGAINLETDAADNVIIGANASGNIIHGNGVNGIYIDNADFTTIQGNWLGTVDGSTRSENTHHGISITGTADNLTIGGDFGAGLGNVISGAGNGRYGILTAGGGTSLVIRGNYIGTDATGNSDLHNEGGGINIGGTYTFTIGGVSAGQENVISGNNTDTNADGINIGNSATGSIINNKIGVGANGSTPLGNGAYGILFANSASGVLVDGNTISNNGLDGIYLGNGSSTLTVTNNIIGLTADGLTALGNTNDGIRITDGNNITISGNTISANGSDGIAINGDQTNLDINTNIIGLDINGEGDMVLDGDGVTVTSDNTFGNQANGIVLNLVDGASSGNAINGNLISGNGVFADANTGAVGIGIYINADTRGFTIQNNVIGLEGDEVTPQKNINAGIYINGLSNSVIGGTGTDESNLIAYNGDHGIEKAGTHMNGVDVYANEFVCNEKGGIGFTSISDVDSPIINLVTSTTISGTTSAEDNSNIAIYEAEDGCSFDQGSLLVVDAVDAVSGGTWTVGGTFDAGKSYVALVVDDETAIDATLSTSEFSAPASISPSVVTNTNDSGIGSLRDAVTYANANPGTSIFFNLPSANDTINVTSGPLPIISENTIIDATTQPGWNFSTGMIPTIKDDCTCDNGFEGDTDGSNIEIYGLRITDFETAGIQSPVSAGALTVGASGKGNIIVNNGSGASGRGVNRYSATNFILQGNYIGVEWDGSPAGNNGRGVFITSGSSAIIGGLSAGEGNVISGSTKSGFQVNTASNIQILGNYIGTDPTGTIAIPNATDMNTSTGGLMFGSVSSDHDIIGNIISGNSTDGIYFQGNDNDTIQSNKIGVDINGAPLGNLGHGINFDGNSSNNVVGGDTGTANDIGYNGGYGINSPSAGSLNNDYLSNAIFGNTSGGIFHNGVSNGGIVPPVIDPISVSTDVAGTGGTTGEVIELFLSDGGGQGQTFLGSTVTSAGTWSVGSLSLTGGDEVVATITDVSNGTSEFSAPESYTFPYPGAEGAGEALSFDGVDDLVVIPNDPSFENPTYTLEAWVSISSNPGNGDTDAFINKGTLDGSLDPNGYTMGYTYDGADYQVFLGHVNGSNAVQPLLVNFTLNLGEWYHVAGVYDGVDQILYVNGIEIGRANADAPDYIGDAADIRIGGYHSLGGISASDFLNAQLDEIRIWDTAISEGQIRQNIAQKIPDQNNLVAYYRMEDSGDAANLIDINGGNSGTISSATYVASGAHLGDVSFSEYTYGAGSGRSLDGFRLENLGVSNLPLHIYRVDQTPTNNTLAGFDNIADTAYYGVFSPGQTYDVSDSIGGLTSDRRILFRNDGADPSWTSISGVLGTDTEDNQIIAFGQSGNGQFVTAIDQNPYPTPVDAGHALSLDGSSWVSIPDNDSFTPASNGLTIELWVNPDDLVAPAEADALVSKYNSIAGQSSWLLDMRNTGTIAFTLYEDVAGTTLRQLITDNPALKDGEWNHVAATYNLSNQDIKIYVNGVEQVSSLTSATSLSGIANSNSTVRIGNVENASAGANSSRFNGDIDEVRIWDVALSQTNIRDHMIQKIDADFDSLNHLVAYYRFDENSGSTAENLTGDDDGTITGATPIISGAPQAQGVISSYDGTPGILNTAQFGEDINVYYDDATGGIHGYVVQGNPNQVQADGFNDLDQGKYYGIFAPAGQKVDIHMDYSGGNDTNRRIVYRKDALDNAAVGGWERLSGLINTSDAVDSVFAFNVPGGEVSTAVLNPPSAYPLLGTSDPGSALDFDGVDDQVVISDISGAWDSLTVEAWINPSSAQGGEGIIVSQSTSSVAEGWELRRIGTSIQLTFRSSDASQYTASNTLTPDTWQHIAGVWDGSNLIVYVDGVPGSSAGTAGNIPDNGRNLIIGNHDGDARFFQGQIDEVRIWNAALAAGDIAFYSNANTVWLHPNYTDLLAYYRFDDGTGSTVLEDVFSNNDGTLTGMDENTDWVASGALANAPQENTLDFDPGNNDYVTIPSDIVQSDYSAGMTIEFWTYATETVGTAERAVFSISQNGTGDDILRFFYRADQDDYTLVSDGLSSVSSTGGIGENEWHHFAITISNGGDVSLYQDGILVGAETGYPLPSATDLMIMGADVNGGSVVSAYYFKGQIENFRVWNTEISSTDLIGYLGQSDVSGHPSAGSLVVNYDFNLGDAGQDNTGVIILPDVSGNGFDGSLDGAFDLSGSTSNWISSTLFDTPAIASSTQTTNIVPFNISDTDVDITWANGDGERRIVAIFEGIETEMPIPPDNQYFHADSNFGGGDIVDGSWYAVYNGFGSVASVTGLTPGTDYTIAVLEVNGAAGFEAYNSGADADNPFSFTTTGGTPSNYALEFDGTTQYVAVPDAPQFDIDTDWTIEAWIKTPSTGQQNIVTQILGTTGYAFFKIGGTLYLQYYSSGGFQNGGTSLAVAAGIDDDQWHHVAVSQNGSNGKIYVDGSPVLDVNVLLPIDETTADVRFGQDPFVGAYTGSLDEVRFWDYQLSDSEIANRYSNELNGDETGLVAYYPFNDGSPSTLLTDATGNGNDGTLNGMDENTDWVAGPSLNPPGGPDPNAFITTWVTTDGQITIPVNLAYTYDYDVSWTNLTNPGVAEGSLFNEAAAAVLTGLENGSTYQVEISGTFPAIRFNNGGDVLKIQTIEQWGNISWASMNSAFYGCMNLTYNATDVPNLSAVTDMSRMFWNCQNFNGNIGSWDVSTVTTMSSMFREAYVFNQDLSGWDVSSVANMSTMFHTSGFNQPIDSWNVNSVTTMTGMFLNNGVFNQDLGSWDLINVINMSSMFAQASAFNGDISAWDVSGVFNMSGMFRDATVFNQDISGWNMNTVTLMSNMFEGAIAFDQPIGVWDVSNVSDMSFMFFGATAFNHDISGWNTSSLTTADAMFRDASSFNQPIESWNTSNLTSAPSMFYNASAFDQPLAGWDVSQLTELYSMFENAVQFNQDLSTWDVSLVTDFSFMFSGASSFNQDVSGWNTSSASDMSFMLSGTTVFDQDISTWDVSSVEFMDDMLSNSGLSTINYDAALIAWSGQTLQPSVSLGATGLTYSSGAQAARDILTNTPNSWVISGDMLGATDVTPPTPVISSSESDPTNANPILIDIDFGESVTGFAQNDITVSNGSKQNFNNIDSQSFTVEVVPSSDGLITVDIAAGRAQDLAGNNNLIATQFSITYDGTGPVITFDQDGLTVNDVNLSGTISDPSDAIQISIDGGATLSNISNEGDGTWSYALDTDPNYSGDGVYSIYLDAVDELGNQTLFTTGTVTIDQTAPIVTVAETGTSIRNPEISGTIDDATATIEIEVDGELVSASNNGDGTWTLLAGSLSSGLADGTYDVVATATDAAGNVGTDSTTDELIISQTVIALSPSDINSTGFTARWSVGKNVQTYQVDIASSSDFSTFVDGFENFETTATGVFVTNLDFSTNYYYRVRLVNTNDVISDNSNTRKVKTTVDDETLADSLALVQIYDAIAPQGLNWETARLRDWDGVTLDINRTRVDIVNLSGTGAVGDMPNPFTGDALANSGLSNLNGMDVSDNEITGLMDYSSTTISTLFVNLNSLEFDDLEPLVAQGITDLDYSDQASVQYNETTDGSAIEVRYTNDYSLSTNIGGTSNQYNWFQNDISITSGDGFIISGSEAVIDSINYNNMGEFRTEITSSLVPDLTIDVDPQIVWAVADMEVSVSDSDGNPLSAPLDATMLETTRTKTGFPELEKLEGVNTSTFTFQDVVLGNYLVFVESDLKLYIPTYYGNVFEWAEAEILFFRSDDVIEMTMTEVPPELKEGDGDGSLGVLIEEDFGDEEGRIDARRRAAKRKCGLRRKTGGGRTGQDDDEFELIAYGETDENGEFQFGFLPEGTYRFFVEYPGIPLDESSSVEFEVGEAGVSDTDFKLAAFATEDGIEITIEAVLGVILEYFKDLQIYPNPSNEYLNIRYRHLKSGDVKAQLVDLAGNSKWSEDLRNGFDGELRIDVSDFEEGIYILRFYDRENPKDNVVSFRVVVRD